ncbi:MAG TPA: M4 family metallopeptidase [Actinomycetes bacterium]
MRRQLLVAGLAGALATTGLAGVSGPGAVADDTAQHAAAGSPARGGSFTLTGSEAAAYQVPADMRESWSATLADGSRQTRYQQVASGATVFGGQVTVLRDRSGTAEAVIGAYFPGLRAKNDKNVTAGEARATARARNGAGQRDTELRINPATGRTFWQVETRRADSRVLTWVDAGSGTVRKNLDILAHGTGIGVKGDTKTIDTTGAPGAFKLVSADGRQSTYDARNGGALPGVLMTDADDIWDLQTVRNNSPSQPAGVDAHYYADVTDQFYLSTFGRDGLDGEGMPTVSTVHYGARYNNAFWNGAQVTYGDGDQIDFVPFSGSLDVVSHEITHGVTEFTSGLIYENESGALNEAFSDMMGATAEHFAAGGLESSEFEPDWLVAEDISIYDDREAGFRNMADPSEDADPDHYAERYTGSADSGGVHSNSGIANHAYYLAVEGGQNAGCTVNPEGHVHTANCDTTVAGLGLARAADIFYAGFTSLPEFANFCDARNATMSVAGKNSADVSDAWTAVGVVGGCTPGTPPPPPCEGGSVALGVVFSTPHPYGNMGDCTWTFTGDPATSYKVVFDRLALEKNFDYVYVKDGADNTIATYTGVFRRTVSSPCSSGSISVQLVTDPAVTDYGFDARVVAC